MRATRISGVVHISAGGSMTVWPISHLRSSRLFGATVLIFAALFFSSQLALAQFSQQGPKLVGTGAGGGAVRGECGRRTAEGSTAMVGGPGANCLAGAAWIYTRSDGIWTQQGNKLVGTGAVGGAGQGDQIALSNDGNTTIVGG